MAEDDNTLVETLKSRGLTCGKLKSREKRERSEAGEYRKLGINSIADSHEASANKLNAIRTRVCKLR